MKKSVVLKLIAVAATVVMLNGLVVSTSLAAPPVKGDAWGGGNGCYVVEKGDTMFSIGRKFNMNPYFIARFNNIYNPNWIYEGQTLCIPPFGPPYSWDGGMQPWPGHPVPYPNQGRMPGWQPYSGEGMGQDDMGQGPAYQMPPAAMPNQDMGQQFGYPQMGMDQQPQFGYPQMGMNQQPQFGYPQMGMDQQQFGYPQMGMDQQQFGYPQMGMDQQQQFGYPQMGMDQQQFGYPQIGMNQQPQYSDPGMMSMGQMPPQPAPDYQSDNY